jgi:16S rRNA (guanine527-N7)-methyltransferase
MDRATGATSLAVITYCGAVPKGLRAPSGGWPLAAEAAGLGTVLPADASVSLGTWLDRLVEWNARMDLTAARTVEELVDLSLADALVLMERIPEHANVVDVGTGAGAPGLPLAVLRPDLRVTLVEPLAKRTAFLRTVLETIGRGDVQVERTSGARVAETKARTFDVAVSRATFRPEQWLAMGEPLVREGGDIWVLLARAGPPETHLELRETFEYAWPLTGAKRTVARFVGPPRPPVRALDRIR